MTEVYLLAAIWVGLALIATLISIWLRIATAMSEIIVGTVAQLVIGAALGATFLGTDQGWIKFLSSIGAVLLTFLAGVELDPDQLKRNWREATSLGLCGFFLPFLGAPQRLTGCCTGARKPVCWRVSHCRPPRSPSCTP